MSVEEKIDILYYEFGFGVKEIAPYTGFSVQKIYPRMPEAYSKSLASGFKWDTDWTYELECQAVELSEKYSYKYAAKKIGCSVFEVVSLLVRLGKTKHRTHEYERRKLPYTCHQKKIVIDLFNDGVHEYYKLGEKSGITRHSTLVEVLKGVGVYKTREEKFQDYNDPLRHMEVVRLHNSGITYREISEIIGVYSPVKCHRIVEESGEKLDTSTFRSSVRKRLLKGDLTVEHRDAYYEMVKAITNSVYRRYKDIIDPCGLRSKEYHIDHTLSIFDGITRYGAPIGFKKVCHPANLRPFYYKDNLYKSVESNYTYDQLNEAIKAWESKHCVVDWNNIIRPGTLARKALDDYHELAASRGLDTFRQALLKVEGTHEEEFITEVANSDKTTREKVKLLYLEFGLSARELCSYLNISAYLLVRYIKEIYPLYVNVSRTRTWEFKWTYLKESVACLLVKTKSYRWIAKLLGCSVFELVYLLLMLKATKHVAGVYEKRIRMFTQHDKAKVLKLYNSGVTEYYALARATRTNYTFVASVLKQAGLFEPRRPPRL